MSDTTRDLAALLALDPAQIEATVLRHAGSGPRSTSYPTAPVWTEAYGPEAFRCDLAGIAAGAELSLYAHVPFCRSLCHFCACNRIITRAPGRPRAGSTRSIARSNSSAKGFRVRRASSSITGAAARRRISSRPRSAA